MRPVINALQYISQTENQTLGEGSKALGEYNGGIGGLTKTGLSDLSKFIDQKMVNAKKEADKIDESV